MWKTIRLKKRKKSNILIDRREKTALNQTHLLIYTTKKKEKCIKYDNNDDFKLLNSRLQELYQIHSPTGNLCLKVP